MARCRSLLAVVPVSFLVTVSGCGGGGDAGNRIGERTEPGGKPSAQAGDGIFGRIPAVVRKLGPSTVAVLVEGDEGRRKGAARAAG
jgi:hypothetical protein